MAVRLVEFVAHALRVRSAPTLVTESDYASRAAIRCVFPPRPSIHCAGTAPPARARSPSLPLQCRTERPLRRADGQRASARRRSPAVATRSSVAVSATRMYASPGRPVHGSRPGQDAALGGEQLARRPAVEPRPGRPQVEPGLGVVDAEPGGGQPGGEHRAPRRVPGLLLDGVRVVGERGDHGGLHRGGHDQPGLPARRAAAASSARGRRSRTRPGSRPGWTAWRARTRRAAPSSESPRTDSCSTETGVAVQPSSM